MLARKFNMGDRAGFDCSDAPLDPCTYPLSGLTAGVGPHLVSIAIEWFSNASAVTARASIGTPMHSSAASADALSMTL